MSEIEIEFCARDAAGVSMRIDRGGYFYLCFGDIRLSTLIGKIGQSGILDCIGKEAAIEHFGIVEADEDAQP